MSSDKFAMQDLAIHHPRLLVVDADQAVRLALKRLLEGSGCQVLVAGDSQVGALMLASADVDLAIIDIDTLSRGGEEIIEELCRVGIPHSIVALSHAGNSPEVEEALHIRCVLGKPVDAQLLLNRVKHLLQEPRGEESSTRLTKRRLALRRLQANGSRDQLSNSPYRRLYH